MSARERPSVNRPRPWPVSWPVTRFAGSSLDRVGDLRDDPDWIAERLADPRARALMLWEGRPLVMGDADETRLVRLTIEHALDIVPDRQLFLGLDGETPIFAVEIEGAGDPAEGPARGLGRFPDMRAAAALLPEAETAMAGAAKGLFDWRRRHGFCAACGQATRDAACGWKRQCPACATEHFPRLDPVVIMLAVHRDEEGRERCLLGRQAAWPAGRMSALAGFIEPGESLEEACAREIAEESGLTVTAVRYHASQPWPFPSQLMIGLMAEVSDDQARPDQTELEAVVWLSRAEARAVLADAHPHIRPPPAIAIAHRLLADWAVEAD